MKKITFLMICLLTISLASAQLTSVAIVGGGAPGGWPSDPQTDMNQMTAGADNNWTFANIALNGAVKFRGNNSWSTPYNWGAPNPASFPTGTAVVDTDAAITVPPGIYNVTFNSVTAAYSFTVSNAFPVISLIGDSVGGWDPGDDVDMGTLDGIVYTKNMVTLAAGPVKWRQNHTWSDTGNWGPAAADINNLSGVAVVNSPESVNISNPGLYNVTFNKTTLAYAFTNPKVAIVGSGTPGGWPANTPGEIDPHAMATVDGIHYTLTGFTLTTGAVKFRRDNAWDSNWGANTWPTGTGTQNGADIPSVAGTYDITFDASTGAYGFTASTAGTESFNVASLKVYPNPSQNNWNFTSPNEAITNITIVDVLGKTVISASPKTNDTAIDASALGNGIYIAKIATAKGAVTVKLVKN